MAQVVAMSPDTRLAGAKNPNTPPGTLVQMAQDEDWRVRRRVTVNPHTPPDILVQLLADEEEGVRVIAQNNPNLPEEYRQLGKVAQ